MTQTSHTLVAKPIIKDKFWVVTDGEKKVGNILTEGTQYRVIINEQSRVFPDAATAAAVAQVRFHDTDLHSVKTIPYAVWPTDCAATYNDMIDVVRRLHVFTREPDSRCYYAAGWFARQNELAQWQTELCPKYIFLKRYSYLGPFQSESEALEQINTMTSTQP